MNITIFFFVFGAIVLLIIIQSIRAILTASRYPDFDIKFKSMVSEKTGFKIGINCQEFETEMSSFFPEHHSLNISRCFIGKNLNFDFKIFDLKAENLAVKINGRYVSEFFKAIKSPCKMHTSLVSIFINKNNSSILIKNKFSTESEDFNKIFTISATSPQDALMILETDKIQKLIDCSSLNDSIINNLKVIHFYKGNVFFLFNEKEPDSLKEISDGVEQTVQKEIQNMEDILKKALQLQTLFN